MSKKELDELMQKIQNGDEYAFEKLYQQLYKGLYSFIFSIVCSNAFVEDLVQEVFLKVRKNASSYKAGTNASAWIFQIAKNLSFDFLRKENRHTNVDDDCFDFLTEHQQEPETKLYLHNLLIKTLNEKERTIVVLHVQGYKNREIAKILSLPLGTVLWKHNQAIKKLKAVIKEDESE